jgi:pentatricopeptide repeat protein
MSISTKNIAVAVLLVLVAAIIVAAVVVGRPWYTAKKDNDARMNRKAQELRDANPTLYDEVIKGRDALLKQYKENKDSQKSFELVADLATNYQTLGDYINAEKYFKIASNNNPVNTRAWSNLASIYRETGRYDEARDAYEQMIKNVPDDITGYIGLAEMQSIGQAGTKDDAIRVLQQGIDKTKNPTLMEYMARLAKDGKL